MYIRKYLSILSIFLGLLIVQGKVGAEVIFTANLTGDKEVPNPVVTTAFGTATLILNDAEDALSYNIQISGLDLDGLQTPGNTSDDVAGLHFHRNVFGANGPIVFGMINPDNDIDGPTIDPIAGTLVGDWDLTEGNADIGATLATELENLQNQGLYINVHTPQNPGGEIRGQVRGQVISIPEPSTISLVLIACVGFLWRVRSEAYRFC